MTKGSLENMPADFTERNMCDAENHQPPWLGEGIVGKENATELQIHE